MSIVHNSIKSLAVKMNSGLLRKLLLFIILPTLFGRFFLFFQYARSLYKKEFRNRPTVDELTAKGLVGNKTFPLEFLKEEEKPFSSGVGRWKTTPSSYPPNAFLEASLLNRMFKKQWWYFSVSNDRFFVGAALVKFSYISDTFVYVYDKETKVFHKYAGRLPLGLGVNIPDIPLGCATWGTPQNEFVEDQNAWIEVCVLPPPTGQIRLRCNVPVSNSKHKFRLDVTSSGAGGGGNNMNEKLFVQFPIGGNTARVGNFCKDGAVKVQGTLRLNNEEFAISNEHNNALVNLDLTNSVPAYRTAWKWVSFTDNQAIVTQPPSTNGIWPLASTKKTTVESFAINLSEDVYDVAVLSSGDKPAHVISIENVLWIGNKMYALKYPVQINVPPQPHVDEWTITSSQSEFFEEEKVDLSFKPEGNQKDLTDLGVIVSDFIQPFGRFKGKILLQSNIIIEVNEKTAFGVTEDHFALW